MMSLRKENAMLSLKNGVKKTKREYILEAIEDLGSEATFVEVKSWVQKQYGVSITDPPFYTARNLYRKKQAEEKLKQQAEEAVNHRSQTDKLLDTVKTAKSLVEKLGKDNAKALIDCL
jgi:ribosomal protein L7/L12